MNTMVTREWVVKETARAFMRATGRRRLEYRDSLEAGTYRLTIDVLPSNDVEEMRRRAARAGRMLADEARRKRLKLFTAQPPPEGDVSAAQAVSRSQGIAVRLQDYWHPMLDRPIYRLDMLGARYAPPQATA